MPVLCTDPRFLACSPDVDILALMPATPRGWFGGRGLVAWGATEGVQVCSVDRLAEALQTTFDGKRTGVTAGLLTYDGRACFVHFDEHAPACYVPTTGRPRNAAFLTDPTCDFDEASYAAAVEATRERIAAGDVYVLNLTASIAGTPLLPAWETFDQLVQRAGGEMSAYLGTLAGGDRAIASVSTERFVRMRRTNAGRKIEVWPVKGTRPRGCDAATDLDLRNELLADPKERAEHVMVVDLERNDIGRVSVPGTVSVDPLMDVASTPYCHQLVSGVRGDLRPEATLTDVIESLFPCGSVTGAPKRAAMRIIHRLERTARDAYCGALVVAMPGEIDSSVLIRTLEWTSADRATWGAGCGITYDSDAAAEWQELLLKTSPVLGFAAPLATLGGVC